MLVYHGTSAAYLDSILEKGIQPSKFHKKSNWKVSSSPDAVYLTNAYALYFAICAAADDEEHKAIIFEIDTDLLEQHLLAPDEDVLEQGSRGIDGVKGSMEKRTVYYRERLLEYSARGFTWDKSMQAMGTATYHGTIPPSAMTRVALLDLDADKRFTIDCMNPTISLMNYMYCGERYRRMLQHVFGEPFVQRPLDADNILDEFHPMREGFSTVVDVSQLLENHNAEPAN